MAHENDKRSDDTAVETMSPTSDLLEEIIDHTALNFANWTQPFEQALHAAYADLQGLLPDQSERFIQAVWLQFRRIPRLQSCTAESIKAAAMDLALSGLDITQRGEAWLIPHDVKRKEVNPETKVERWVTRTECVVWDGYIGRLKLARQAPGVLDAWADVVRANDQYQFHGTRAVPEHTFPSGFADRGPIVGAYCVVQFADGRALAHQMSKAEILSHRDQYARAAQADIWQEQLFEWKGSGNNRKKVETGKENFGFQHMCCKVVINQVCHPRNIEMPRSAQRIIAGVDHVTAALQPATGETTQPTQPVRSSPESIPDLFGDPVDTVALVQGTPAHPPSNVNPVTGEVAESDSVPDSRPALLNEITAQCRDNIPIRVLNAWIVTQYPDKSRYQECTDAQLEHILAHLRTHGADACTRDLAVQSEMPLDDAKVPERVLGRD